MRPAKLFKYASLAGERLGYARAVVLDRALFFSSPTTFNDPFECRFQYSMEATLQQWRRFCSRPLVAESLGFSQWTPPTDAILREWATKAPAQVRWLCEVFRKGLERETAICCFSAKPNDILMWSHYADSHRGICFEFTPAKHSDIFANLQPVNYQTEYPRVNFITLSDEEWARLVYATKSEHWSYEAEWRAIEGGRSGVRRYAPGELTGIILGSNIPKPLEGEVYSWVAQVDGEISIRRARRSDSEYSLLVD